MQQRQRSSRSKATAGIIRTQPEGQYDVFGTVPEKHDRTAVLRGLEDLAPHPQGPSLHLTATVHDPPTAKHFHIWSHWEVRPKPPRHVQAPS